jgi:hypothetical protein
MFFVVLISLVWPLAVNAFAIPATCKIGLRVEFAKSVDGNLEPLPGERVSLVDATAWLSAYTTARAPNDSVPGRKVNIDKGSAIKISHCNSSTDIRFDMELSKKIYTDYVMMYRPVFNLNGKKVAFAWGRLESTDRWLFDRPLSWFQEYYP